MGCGKQSKVSEGIIVVSAKNDPSLEKSVHVPSSLCVREEVLQQSSVMFLGQYLESSLKYNFEASNELFDSILQITKKEGMLEISKIQPMMHEIQKSFKNEKREISNFGFNFDFLNESSKKFNQIINDALKDLDLMKI